MTPPVLDETPAAFAPALKATLREILAQAPPELLKGIRKIILSTAVTDPHVLRVSGQVSSQYIYRDGTAIIHLFLSHIDKKPWRIVPLSWRPWSRARLASAALSLPLAHQKYRGKAPGAEAVRLEARKIQVALLLRWAPFWMEKFPVESRLKELFRRFLEARIRRLLRAPQGRDL